MFGTTTNTDEFVTKTTTTTSTTSWLKTTFSRPFSLVMPKPPAFLPDLSADQRPSLLPLDQSARSFAHLQKLHYAWANQNTLSRCGRGFPLMYFYCCNNVCDGGRVKAKIVTKMSKYEHFSYFILIFVQYLLIVWIYAGGWSFIFQPFLHLDFWFTVFSWLFIFDPRIYYSLCHI